MAGTTPEASTSSRLTIKCNEALVEEKLYGLLSDREREVFICIVRGDCDTNYIRSALKYFMGTDLVIPSGSTVNTYKARIREALGLRNNVEMALYAMQQGFLTLTLEEEADA